VSIGWTTVPFNDPDEPIVTVMSWLLDNDTSGLLNLELELSQKVPDAAANSSNSRESGYFTVRATARDGQSLEEVEQLLLGTVAKLKAGAFTQADIDAIVLANDIRRKLQFESTDGRVYKLMESFVYRQPWPKMLDRDERLRKVTRDDVMRVANAHLGPGMSVVYRRNGKPTVAKIDKPKISPLPIDPTRKSKFAAQIEAMKAPELTPEWLVEGTHYARADLPAGPLVAVVNKRNDLFSIDLAFDRGSQRDPLLCHAFDMLEQAGAADKSAEERKRQLFALGSTVTFSCDAYESSISVRGVDANMAPTLTLLETWLRDPKIDPTTLEKLTANTISKRHDSVEDPESLWSAVAEYAMRDRASEYLLAPSNKALQAAKAGQLTALVKGTLDHAHKTMYFGPRPLADVQPLLSLGKSHKKLTRRPPITYRKAKESQVYFVHREVAKSYVWVAIPHGVGSRDLKPRARLLNTYLGGGMNALLFQEMREARGLVYFSFGFVNQGRYPDDTWSMSGGMGTQVDKTPEALTTYLDLIRGKTLDDARISTARASLDQEFRSSRIDPRESIWWIDAWDDAGEKTDPRPWTWEQIGAMTPDQLKEFAKSFADKPVLVGVVGDRNRVDLTALAKVGKVVELRPEQLFSYGPFPKPAVAAAPAK
jgi:predicted Zn-dependent peptidase